MKVPDCIGLYGSCQFECDPVTDPRRVSVFEHPDAENRRRVECDPKVRSECFRLAWLKEQRRLVEAMAGRFHGDVHAPDCTCVDCWKKRRER